MNDKLYKLSEQSEDHGWDYGRYHFRDTYRKDHTDGVYYFNPTIVQRPEGRYLIARRLQLSPTDPWGINRLELFETDGHAIGEPQGRLQFLSQQEDQQDEDPRAFQYGDHTFVSCCSYYHYNPGWSGAHQLVGSFDENWKCTQDAYPPIGGNTQGVHSVVRGNEKNWVWFMDREGRMCLAYSFNVPWQIVRFHRGDWENHQLFESKGLKWDYGTIRAGTNPVLVDGLLWSFFHSSLAWPIYNRRYFMGALAFEATPPFRPRLISKEPLLRASDRDETRPDKPLVVFPCGALLDKGSWLVTMGVNDCFCASVTIPHKEIYDSCTRVE